MKMIKAFLTDEVIIDGNLGSNIEIFIEDYCITINNVIINKKQTENTILTTIINNLSEYPSINFYITEVKDGRKNFDGRTEGFPNIDRRTIINRRILFNNCILFPKVYTFNPDDDSVLETLIALIGRLIKNVSLNFKNSVNYDMLKEVKSTILNYYLKNEEI